MAAMEVKKVYCRRKREKHQQIDHIPKCFQLPRTPSASKPRTDFSLPICSSKDIELEPLSSKEIQSSVIVGSSDTSNDKIRDIDDPSSTRSTEPESRRQETPTNCMELTVVKSFGEKAQMQPCSNRNDEGRDDNATVLEFTPNRSQLTENSEVCATPGSVVWAKTGQCWWPAEILGEKSSKSGSRVERHLLVQYFGKNGSAWVDPATDLSPFEECFKERSCNRAKEFQNALKQALHYKEHPRSCKESSGSPDGRDRSSHQLPVIWWDNFGDETPELKAFAIRILGLTCSTSTCEHSWSMFNQMHIKRRSHLSTHKMNNLVYVTYNKKLRDRFLKKQSLKEEDDPLIVDEVPSDDEWIANRDDEEDSDNNDLPIEVDVGVEDAGPSSLSRKRKSNQVDLEDEDDSDNSYDERDNSSSSSRAGTDCTGRARSKRERKRKVHFDEVSCPLYTSRKVRRFKIMRSLGLAAPVGSPFNTS